MIWDAFYPKGRRCYRTQPRVLTLIFVHNLLAGAGDSLATIIDCPEKHCSSVEQNTGWKPLLHYAVASPARAHGNSSQMVLERSLNSPENQCSIGFQPVFCSRDRAAFSNRSGTRRISPVWAVAATKTSTPKLMVPPIMSAEKPSLVIALKTLLANRSHPIEELFKLSMVVDGSTKKFGLLVGKGRPSRSWF